MLRVAPCTQVQLARAAEGATRSAICPVRAGRAHLYGAWIGVISTASPRPRGYNVKYRAAFITGNDPSPRARVQCSGVRVQKSSEYRVAPRARMQCGRPDGIEVHRPTSSRADTAQKQRGHPLLRGSRVALRMRMQPFEGNGSAPSASAMACARIQQVWKFRPAAWQIMRASCGSASRRFAGHIKRRALQKRTALCLFWGQITFFRGVAYKMLPRQRRMPARRPGATGRHRGFDLPERPSDSQRACCPPRKTRRRRC